MGRRDKLCTGLLRAGDGWTATGGVARSMSEIGVERQTGVPIRYVLVLWLMVLSSVAYLDRTNISIAGIEISQEFAISKIRLGGIFSAFLIGYAGFQIPAGLLARRLGPRRTLGLLGVWWGFFIAMTALIPRGTGEALAILVMIRFALGAGEATMYPATGQFVERWFPVKERGKANGFIFAGVGLGAGLTPALVNAIIAHHGWRTSFAFSACVGATAGLVWYLLARDTPEGHPWVGDAERALIVSTRRVARVGEEDTARYGKHRVPWAGHSGQQGNPSADGELFFIWVCGVAVLRVDVHLHGAGARAESEDERAVCGAAVYRNDDRLHDGRDCERLDCGAVWAADRAVSAAGGRAGADGGAATGGVAGRERGDGSDGAGAGGGGVCTWRRAASGRSRRTSRGSIRGWWAG